MVGKDLARAIKQYKGDMDTANPFGILRAPKAR